MCAVSAEVSRGWDISCENPGRCLEFNLGSLEEQLMLLTMEPSITPSLHINYLIIFLPLYVFIVTVGTHVPCYMWKSEDEL